MIKVATKKKGKSNPERLVILKENAMKMDIRDIEKAIIAEDKPAEDEIAVLNEVLKFRQENMRQSDLNHAALASPDDAEPVKHQEVYPDRHGLSGTRDMISKLGDKIDAMPEQISVGIVEGLKPLLAELTKKK